MRDAALRGDRISAERAVEIVDDTLGCTILDIHNNNDEHCAPMDPLPCPITIAWAEKDTVLPLELYGMIARDRLPGAAFSVLPDVAHVPMLDDPELVARTILVATGAANLQ
jgi:pimeloyl-ACP methyl ester carboxylesterase